MIIVLTISSLQTSVWDKRGDKKRIKR